MLASPAAKPLPLPPLPRQVALPVESASGQCFLQLYIENILALGVRSKEALQAARLRSCRPAKPACGSAGRR